MNRLTNRRRSDGTHLDSDDKWFGSEFHIPEATDENDLEAVMVVLREGTHIDKDDEERSASVGTNRGMRDAR